MKLIFRDKCSVLQDKLLWLLDIKRILHECSCFIEFIKRVEEKR